jgi:hypothetical protein
MHFLANISLKMVLKNNKGLKKCILKVSLHKTFKDYTGMNSFKHFTQKALWIYGLHFKEASDINQVMYDK